MSEEDETKLPIEAPELTDEQESALKKNAERMEEVEQQLMCKALELQAPILKERSKIIETIPLFWSTALSNHATLAMHVSIAEDAEALTYLQNIHIERDHKDPREWALIFKFSENPFFENKELSRSYKLKDEDKKVPFTFKSLVDFNPLTQLEVKFSDIKWKETNLISKFPRSNDEDMMEPGSFFHLFTSEDDMDMAEMIRDDLYPNSIEYLYGVGPNAVDDDDSEEEGASEEESGYDDEEETDGRPLSKKAKNN